MESFDLIILGSGMAAIPAMKRAVELGAKTACVTGTQFGGTCLNVGCIPTKALWECVNAKETVRNASTFGIKVNGFEASWEGAFSHKERAVATLKGLRKEAIEEWGVTLFEGNGRFASPDTVEVGGESLHGKRIVVATGARPYIPPVPGIEHAIVSDQALELRELPKTIFIIGMGPIGLEFATFFSHFGSKVYLARRKSMAFPEDQDVSLFIDRILKEQGIVVLTGNEVKRIEKRGEKLFVRCACAENTNRIFVDSVLAATGRVPNIENLDLQRAEVKVGPRGVIVNEYLQTTNSNVYAAGDVVGHYQLTAIANSEGEIAVENAVNGNKRIINHEIVPDCISTYPWIAKVGVTVEQARRKRLDAESMKIPYNRFPRGVVSGHFEEDGFIKIIYEKKSGKLLGGIIIGTDADNLIHIVATAMKGGLTIQDLADLPFFHPSLSEGIRYASKRQIVGRAEEDLCCTV